MCSLLFCFTRASQIRPHNCVCAIIHHRSTRVPGFHYFLTPSNQPFCPLCACVSFPVTAVVFSVPTAPRSAVPFSSSTSWNLCVCATSASRHSHNPRANNGVDRWQPHFVRFFLCVVCLFVFVSLWLFSLFLSSHSRTIFHHFFRSHNPRVNRMLICPSLFSFEDE